MGNLCTGCNTSFDWSRYSTVFERIRKLNIQRLEEGLFDEIADVDIQGTIDNLKEKLLQEKRQQTASEAHNTTTTSSEFPQTHAWTGELLGAE